MRLEAAAQAPLVIGTVCVLRREKNLLQLIEVFAKIRAGAPSAKLLIVGSGPEEPALKDAASRLALGDAAVFLPTASDVVPALRSIDLRPSVAYRRHAERGDGSHGLRIRPVATAWAAVRS